MTATPLPPAHRRWAAYFNERFKIGLNLFATVLMVGTVGTAAALVHGASLNVWATPQLYLIALAYLLVFFHLRIFDEHKDFAIDSVRFPERVLSRGWVTLDQLRRIAYVIIPLELVLAYAAGMPFFWGMLAVIAYTFLMLKEFFVADWLKRHMVLYGVSHMASLLLMVIVAMVGFKGAIPEPYDPFHPALLTLAAVFFCFVYSLEMARKIRPPELEKPDVDTYSKLLGIQPAIYAVIGCQMAALVLLWLSGVPVPPIAWGVIVAAQAGIIASLLGTARRPEPAKLAKLDNVAAGPYLVMQITLLVAWSLS